MNRLFIILATILVLAGISAAAITYDETYYKKHCAYVKSGNVKLDPVYLFIKEAVDILDAVAVYDGDSITFTTNGQVLNCGTNNEITLTEAGEDLDFVFTSNAVAIRSPTDAAVSINGTGYNNALNLNVGTCTGAVTIGGTGTQTIAIGDGAGVKTVSLGSSNTTSATTILSGSAGVNVNVSGDDPVNIATGTSTGTVSIGGSAAQTIAVGSGGTSSSAKTVTVGSATGASATTITGGTGGITLTSAPGIKLTNALVLNDVQTFTDTDTTPDVSGYSYWNTGTTGATITNFDGTGRAAGQILVVVSKGAIVYDVTTTNLKGGTTDITTAAGDVTTWIWDGTNWLLIAFMDMSKDLEP